MAGDCFLHFTQLSEIESSDSRHPNLIPVSAASAHRAEAS